MELGNVRTEINDAEEQQRRFDEQPAHVEGVRGDPDYVEALFLGMPPTGGLGLGIDRLGSAPRAARPSATSSFRRCVTTPREPFELPGLPSARAPGARPHYARPLGA